MLIALLLVMVGSYLMFPSVAPIFLSSPYLNGVILTVFFFGLMFLGGSAGSTSGGIKVVRHLLMIKGGILEFKRALNRLKKDVWALVSALYILGVCGIAVFAYQKQWIVDGVEHAVFSGHQKRIPCRSAKNALAVRLCSEIAQGPVKDHTPVANFIVFWPWAGNLRGRVTGTFIADTCHLSPVTCHLYLSPVPVTCTWSPVPVTCTWSPVPVTCTCHLYLSSDTCT